MFAVILVFTVFLFRGFYSEGLPVLFLCRVVNAVRLDAAGGRWCVRRRRRERDAMTAASPSTRTTARILFRV